jgi:hypothetical protein
MIKVLIIDNNPQRHSDFLTLIENIIPDVECIFLEECDIDIIPSIGPLIILVHKNNPEFGMIAADSSLAKYRIFFSGSYSGSFKESDFEHYVKDNAIESALIQVRDHLTT